MKQALLLLLLALTGCELDPEMSYQSRECRGWISLARTHQDSVQVMYAKPMRSSATCAMYLSPSTPGATIR